LKAGNKSQKVNWLFRNLWTFFRANL